MSVNRDYRDMFAALNAVGADYLLVGGLAVAYHSAPRYTKDVDIFVRATAENAVKVHAALAAFGAPLREIRPEDFATPDIVFQIGVEPNRIDVITSIDGVSFDEAWPKRVQLAYGDQDVPVIGLAELIRNKTESGKHPKRMQDRIDVEVLKKLKLS